MVEEESGRNDRLEAPGSGFSPGESSRRDWSQVDDGTKIVGRLMG